MLNVVTPIGGMAMQQTWQKLVGTLNSLATLPKWFHGRCSGHSTWAISCHISGAVWWETPSRGTPSTHAVPTPCSCSCRESQSSGYRFVRPPFPSHWYCLSWKYILPITIGNVHKINRSYPTLPFAAINSCLRNTFNSLKKSTFRSSGQPFIGREEEYTESHCGFLSLVDVPGIFLPVSSCTHQQYPVDR